MKLPPSFRANASEKENVLLKISDVDSGDYIKALFNILENTPIEQGLIVLKFRFGWLQTRLHDSGLPKNLVSWKNLEI